MSQKMDMFAENVGVKSMFSINFTFALKRSKEITIKRKILSRSNVMTRRMARGNSSPMKIHNSMRIALKMVSITMTISTMKTINIQIVCHSEDY